VVEKVWAVRAHMVDGAVVDLLLFADHGEAVAYAKSLDPLPAGFDFADVVARRVIGSIVERRKNPRPLKGLAMGGNT